jgi:pimeloyl-ACP methyl ester carboxylesterase
MASSVAMELVAAGQRLEAEWHGPRGHVAPTLVLLHEGLGCVAMWRDWPAELAQKSGLGVLVYSRAGYGGSEPVTPPRPLTYMHDEGERVLPAVLDAAGIERALLVGHSDGGSIAIVHAGTAAARGRVAGLALLAAHVSCEDISVASIARAREAYVGGEGPDSLRARLMRYHGANVDGAFWGWNRAWLDPDFRRWNLEEYLPRIEVPVLAVQGEDDPYGTLAQVEAIARGVRGEFRQLILPRCGHAPQRESRVETTAAVLALARDVLTVSK